VSSLSPANTVAPTEAAAFPTCACSAYTTVPEPGNELPRIGAVSKPIVNNIDRLIDAVPRVRDILLSKGTEVLRIKAFPKTVNL
jgi:hypothetical protein